MTSEILISLVSAALGFLGGLLAPWVRWVIDKRRLERIEKTTLISEWRKALEVFDFENETIGDSVWYSSLRTHMTKDAISKIEAINEFYVGGGRGKEVKKHILLDEVARLEKELWRQ